MHLAWGILTVALIWWWARKVWSNSLAWRSVAVLISMPSLPLLASWAYTDLALAFYSVAVLYTLWLSQDLVEKRTWVLSGLLCGLAMGVKYTSFILPLVVIGWLIWMERRHLSSMLVTGVKFAVPDIFVASPWYLRIRTTSLWQSRLLFPALLPLAPLAALAWEAFARLDTRRFRFSFIFNTLVILSIAVSLLDFGLFVLTRNPLAAALGMTDRQAYFKHFQPAYADALSLVSQTPAGARIYFLFEPRSFGMSRSVTPDIINHNLAHDLYLYHTPENVLRAWQAQEYTYVLYQHIGDGSLENPKEEKRLFSLLDVAAETPNTILYRIPSP